MSRTPLSRLHRRRGDEGFTLVEVLASLTVFGLVASAATAMFISGLRASLMTKMDTTAKNISQQAFETIRNLPYHLDQVSAGGVNPPDLLDTYFVNATGSVGRGVTGYVPAGAARWTTDGDPATGAFYRVVTPAVPGFPQYKQYVATQFLDDTGVPFSPPTTFNTQTAGADTPPTATVGVGVTTMWSVGTIARTHRTYSQITAGRPGTPNAVLQSRMTALRLSGGLLNGQSLTADLGAITADGTVSTTNTAASSGRGATVVMSSGQTIQGAVASAQAPPNVSLGNTSGPQTLTVGTTTYGTFGSSSANAYAQTSTGQPIVGTSSNPVRGDLLGAGSGAKVASFAIDSTAPARLGLLATHAYVEDAGCGGGCTNVGASGYSSSTISGSTHAVTTNATAAVKGALVLLPTSFAPNGLIRITMSAASVSCSVSRSGAGTAVGTADVSYTGSLAYFAPTSPSAVNGYVTVPLSSTQSASPLTGAILTGTQVAVDSSGVPVMLSDYFASWTSLNSGGVASARTISADGTTATASVSGMIGVTSVPLRSGDSTSVVGAQLGVASCDAEDYR